MVRRRFDAPLSLHLPSTSLPFCPPSGESYSTGVNAPESVRLDRSLPTEYIALKRPEGGAP